MEHRVFRYRSGGLVFTAIFLAIWSGGWLYGVASNWNHPGIGVNGRPATARETTMLLWAALVLGVAIAMADLAAFLCIANCRIEIENGRIRWYDFLGRLRVQGNLRGAKLTESTGRNGGGVLRIQTDGGTIRLTTGIGDYGALLSMLNGVRPSSFAPRGPQSPVLYVPPTKTYRYRWSAMHVFSFVWLVAVCFIARGIATSSESGKVVSALGLVGFALIGAWMQLTGWVERISLGPDGVRWFDCFGRLRVAASFEEIFRVETQYTGGGAIRIHTSQGTICVSNYLGGSDELVREIERTIESRTARPKTAAAVESATAF